MTQRNMISPRELEKTISDFMLELGIPAHLRGYQFLRSAVGMCVEDMELVGSVTKLLYPDLAKMYQTTDTKIERAIRNAIEVSWDRGNSDLFEELFGYSNTLEYTRPTNSEYIAVVADYIRLKNNLI
ncbi:MAG: sporulation initiation factor Spo0A C-terminal domain-containing protein [Lachnospiraceae bacterium]|nr:sporulation initiation factor Spo0A C-terminal domain-containing protein [Lachnospiraceae bacterium]